MTDAVKERPILFSGQMVRAILEGRKTQTRRVMKPQPKYLSDMPHDCDGWYWVSPKKINGCEQVEAWKNDAVGLEWMRRHCPYGGLGDRLWVRETWADIPETTPGNLHYKASSTSADLQWFLENNWKWRPSIHMPRWASRITLEVTGVRVERLQDISEEDAKAEGCDIQCSSRVRWTTYRDSFHFLWDSLAKTGKKWIDNPWVWVIEFRRVDDG